MQINEETEISRVEQNLNLCKKAIAKTGFSTLSVELGIEPQGTDHMDRKAIDIVLGELILCSFSMESPLDEKKIIDTISREMNFIKSGLLD
jgi:hypothetical protein